MRRLQQGDRTKFSTFKGIAEATAISELDWAALLPYWIKVELGEDAALLRIELTNSATGGGQIRTDGPLSELFAGLTPEERENIVETMQRPELIAAVPALLKLAAMRNGNGGLQTESQSLGGLTAPAPAMLAAVKGERVDQGFVRPPENGSEATDSGPRVEKQCRTELLARAARNRPWDQL